MPEEHRGEALSEGLLARVRYVPRHMGHHGRHSGYDLLFRHMGLREAYSPTLAWIGRHMPKSIAWRLWQMRPQAVNRDGLAPELGAARWARGGARRVCHFIYGEDTFFFTPLWRGARNRMIASFHYPPSLLQERVSPAAAGALDAVILLGNNQREYFERLLPRERIFLSPHHVDTGFFSPPAAARAEASALRAICAGVLFRDFDVLADLIERAHASRTPFRFDLVIPVMPAKERERFARLPNTHLHSGISDAELVELYRAADIGIMPMTDCTANNALLEMMACGLPVVASDVGAIRDYASPEGALLVPPRDADAFSEAVMRLAGERESRLRMGAANRKRAESEFSLDRCAVRMREIYEQMLF